MKRLCLLVCGFAVLAVLSGAEDKAEKLAAECKAGRQSAACRSLKWEPLGADCDAGKTEACKELCSISVEDYYNMSGWKALVVVGGKKGRTGLQRACKGGLEVACWNTAFERNNIPLLQSLCDKKHPLACERLGDASDRGKGVAKDKAKALQRYEQACDLGNAWGCYRAEAIHRKGDGVPKNEANAGALRARYALVHMPGRMYLHAVDHYGQRAHTEFPVAAGSHAISVFVFERNATVVTGIAIRSLLVRPQRCVKATFSAGQDYVIRDHFDPGLESWHPELYQGTERDRENPQATAVPMEEAPESSCAIAALGDWKSVHSDDPKWRFESPVSADCGEDE